MKNSILILASVLIIFLACKKETTPDIPCSERTNSIEIVKKLLPGNYSWAYTVVTFQGGSSVQTPTTTGLNYKYIFEKYPYFWEGLRNSCIWALCGLVIQVPIATGVALVISKKCRGWKLARNIYVIPNIISSAAMGLIFLQLYNPKYGIINEIIRVFVPNFQDNVLFIPKVNMIALTCAYIFFAGTNMIMVLGQISAIPEEVREAALLDGAKGWTLDRCIVLPLIKDTIKTISILSVSAGFLLYNEVYFLTNGAAGTKSISFLIRELAVVSPRAQYARANAIGAIQILGGLVLILIINMLFRERKQKGGRR